MNQTDAAPLAGLRILDCSALGPGPFASRMLADFGAEVITVEAPVSDDPFDSARMFGRGKRSIVVDLKVPGADQLLFRIAQSCDVLIESMRPGKMEALGLGPDDFHQDSPHLIYARLTAFGQDGPLAQAPGHDINAIAVAGALAAVGLDQPLPPAGFVGDIAAGSLMLVIGILMALHERQRTQRGRVIDVSMCDGASYLMGGVFPLWNQGVWRERGHNLLDGSRPFYSTYRCADDKWLAVGAIEARFFRNFIAVLGLDDQISVEDQFKDQYANSMRSLIQERIAEHSRNHWVAAFEGVDACVSPVLEIDELAEHPHHRARGSVLHSANGLQPGVAPKFLPGREPQESPVPAKGADTVAILHACGFVDTDIDALAAAGTIQLPV